MKTESAASTVLSELNDVRYALMRLPPNSPVDLRDHIPVGTASWRLVASTSEARGTRGPRVDVVAWLDAAVARLEDDGAVAMVQGAVRRQSAPEKTPLRQLTTAGIERARKFVSYLREHPGADRTPPDELLYGETCSRPFGSETEISVTPQTFRTRREAGAYLSTLLAPVRRRVLQDAGVWSWLGMFYLKHFDLPKLSPEDMTIVVALSASSGRHSHLQTYRHYLWGSWRLYEQHGEAASYLLDQPISSLDDLAARAMGSARVFSSRGVVQLMLRLYTQGSRRKPRYVYSPGGLRHLMRVLPQLELTYDVYGMEPEAILAVLPEPFQRWARQKE